MNKFAFGKVLTYESWSYIRRGSLLRQSLSLFLTYKLFVCKLKIERVSALKEADLVMTQHTVYTGFSSVLAHRAMFQK